MLSPVMQSQWPLAHLLLPNSVIFLPTGSIREVRPNPMLRILVRGTYYWLYQPFLRADGAIGQLLCNPRL
jgi:hypothetical protein